MTVNWITGLVDYSENVFGRLAVNGAKYVAAFFCALIVSLILTPVFREIARKIGMVDMPNARRINTVPIPRGGGLSIFIAFHLVLGVLVFTLGRPVSSEFSNFWQGRFLLASSVLVVLGLVDDKHGLRPGMKLFGQIGVALILYLSGVHVGGLVIAFPPWLDGLATVFWIVGAVNAFNLIDGMDGLATGLALIASVGLAGSLLFTGQSAMTLPFLVLAGACLGFLRYNFHPASVFLGDTGSMFLGLCVATLPLMTGSRKELVAALGMPLLAMGVPIFDTLLAIWRRSVRALLPCGMGTVGMQTRVMQPDKDHLHHRILRETMNQRTAAIILYGVGALLVSVGLVGTLLRNRAPGLFLIAFIFAIIVVVRHLERIELWDTGRLLSRQRPTMKRGLIMPVFIVVDAFSLCAVWCVSRWMLQLPLNRVALLSDLPMYVVPVFVFLVLARTYWRVWSRAQMRDFALLAVTIFAGVAVAMGLVALLDEQAESSIRFAVLFATFSVFPLFGVRLWQDSLQGIVQVLERKVLTDKPGTVRVFAYGGGVRFRSYMREMAVHSGQNTRVLLGILDDDVNLRGRIIAGYTVLGGLDELPELVAKWHVDALVITCLLDDAHESQIVRVAESAGVAVSKWVCDEEAMTASAGKDGK